MFSDKLFTTAFIVSLAVHGLIISGYPGFKLSEQRDKDKKTELRYVKQPMDTKSIPKKEISKQDILINKLPARITMKDNPAIGLGDKQNILKRNRQIISPNPEFSKPDFVKPDSIVIKKKVTLPQVDLDKVNNPSYISYYQIVREKIRRSAYQNYTRTETGQVYLGFVISRDGLLKAVRLIEEKSSPNIYLRETAIRSVHDASPFPDFPKELDYPQLSFNVAISFEIE